MIEVVEVHPVIVEERSVTIREVSERQVVFGGEQGPQGPQGIPGQVGGTVLQYVAGENLGGHRMVVLNDSQQAVYASNDNPAHAVKVLGMTTGAANIGDLSTIQTGGEITEPSWDWVLNTPVCLSTNGLLTQTQPLTGFIQIIGFPITTTKIFINLREPITLN